MPTDHNNKKQECQSLLIKLLPISLTERIFFVQNLSIMIKSGIPLSQALKTLTRQIKNKRFLKITQEVQQKVESGQSFAESLKPYPKVFNDLFVNMIKAGEVSGKLEEALNDLHIQMKKDHDLISKIKSAMTYPLIIIMAMIGIGALMIIFVVPKITTLFNEMNAELPLTTKIMISLSNFLVAYLPLVGISLVALIIGLLYFIKKRTTGKKLFHKLLLKMPVMATISKKINLARFARTLSSLIKTDIPIIESFLITARVVGNIHYKIALKEIAEKIKKGASLEETFNNYPKLFPPVIVQMIAVGEQTGSLEVILEELATFYEEDIKQTMESLPSIIEPILILILGGVIAAMAVAIVMPMYSLTQQF